MQFQKGLFYYQGLIRSITTKAMRQKKKIKRQKKGRKQEIVRSMMVAGKDSGIII